MVGNKQLWKHWNVSSLESQVSEIKEEIEQKVIQNSTGNSVSVELLIPTEPEPLAVAKKKRTYKKKKKIKKDGKPINEPLGKKTKSRRGKKKHQ